MSGGTTEKIPRDVTGDRSLDRPTSSAAPQSLRHRRPRLENHYNTKFPISSVVNKGLRTLFLCDVAQPVLVGVNRLFGTANCPILFVRLIFCFYFSSSFCPAPAFSSIFFPSYSILLAFPLSPLLLPLIILILLSLFIPTSKC